MKKLLIIAVLFSNIVNAQFIDEDWTQASIWVDPTFTDSGYQIGAEITKVMHWGYASASVSVYDDATKDVGYADMIGTFGLNWYFNRFNGIRYYSGFRLGLIKRKSPEFGTSTYPMVGGVVGVDFNLTKNPRNNTRFVVGFRLWTDYREDQKNQFYGDSDGYERGLVTNNPLLQENGAMVLTIVW